jgi:hypothetical protein
VRGAAQLRDDRLLAELAAVPVHERLDLAGRPLLDLVEDRLELGPLHVSCLDAAPRRAPRGPPGWREDLERLVVGLVDQRADLAVDLGGDLPE